MRELAIALWVFCMTLIISVGGCVVFDKVNEYEEHIDCLEAVVREQAHELKQIKAEQEITNSICMKIITGEW